MSIYFPLEIVTWFTFNHDIIEDIYYINTQIKKYQSCLSSTSLLLSNENQITSTCVMQLKERNTIPQNTEK